MSSTEDFLPELDRLRAENERLRALLRAHGIEVPKDVPNSASDKTQAIPGDVKVSKRSPVTDRIALFLSLFQGREDVYARRWEGKNGRSGYSPVCGNEWRRGVCLKPKGKCADCAKAEYFPFDENAVAAHLSGRCVLGVYPLLPDETCHFLAIDFDEAQFYRAQAMRMPVWNIPRIIYCAEYCDDTLALPRGCLEDVSQWLNAHSGWISIRDERCLGRSIDVTFNGTLRGEQAAALEALSACDNGILSATTAFGKTVVGAALIAEKRVNTLVLVHRSQLMTQWKERFLQDVANGKESVVIVSPFVTVRRVRWIEGALAQCIQKRVRVSVVTRDVAALPAKSRGAAQTAIRMLQAQQAEVVCREGIHQKYAIVDGSIVWYGSINLLSFGASQESVMRLVSSSIARALVRIK